MRRASDKERWAYVLSIAQMGSEITIMIGLLIIIYIAIRQII